MIENEPECVNFEELLDMTREERKIQRNGLPQPIHDLEEEIIELTKNVKEFVNNRNSIKNQD